MKLMAWNRPRQRGLSPKRCRRINAWRMGDHRDCCEVRPKWYRDERTNTSFPIGKQWRTKMTLTMTRPRLAGRTDAFTIERGTHWWANYLDSPKIFWIWGSASWSISSPWICCCRQRNHEFVRNWSRLRTFPLKAKLSLSRHLWTGQQAKSERLWDSESY